MRGMAPRTRASTPSGGSHAVDVEGDRSTAARYSTRPTWTPRSRGSNQLSRPAPQLENAASRADERFQACFAAQRLGGDGRDAGRRLFERRSAAGRGHGNPTWSGCRNRVQTCGVAERDILRQVIATRGDASPSLVPTFGPRPASRGFPHRGAQPRRDRRRRADRGGRRVRPRRHRRRHRRTRRPLPRRRSGRPRAHVVGRSRRLTPRSTGASSLATTPDWVNIDHRRGRAFAPGELNAYVRARWDDGCGLSITSRLCIG